MSIRYEVLLSLSTTGSLDAKLGSVGSAAEKVEKSVAKVGSTASNMGSAIEGFGGRMSNALDAVASKVIEVGVGIAKWGGAALLAGAVYGVASLNAQLETTQISLGSIFQAQGLTGSFTGGMSMARDQVVKMKQDVMTLPGTFMQLAQMMQTTATTGIAGGMNADALRKFAGRTMMTASIVAPTIDNNLLQKEIVNLMSGKAGTHNIFGLRLGLQGSEAKAFNALAPEKRLEALNKIYDKYKDATDAIGVSWKAQWTSLKDNALYNVLQPITQPLFTVAKAELVEINEWFNKNQYAVNAFTRSVGTHLAGAFESVVNGIRKMEPVFEKIAAYIKSFDMDKLKAIGMMAAHAGEAYALGKVAAAGVSLAGTAIGAMGGAAGAGEAAAMAATLPIAAAALVTLGIATIGTIGAIDNLTEADNEYHHSATLHVEEMKKNVEAINGDIKRSVEDMHTAVKPAIDGIGEMFLLMGDHALHDLRFLTGQVSTFMSAYHKPEDDVVKLDAVDESLRLARLVNEGRMSQEEANVYAHRHDTYKPGGWMRVDETMDATRKKPEQRNFGTTIQKVEIVVKGSDDPSRVAKSVLRHFQDWQRNRTSNHPLLKGLGT